MTNLHESVPPLGQEAPNRPSTVDATCVIDALSRRGARAAVFRALFLGDLLCAIPAVRSLRLAYPGLRLTLISLPWAREFALRFGQYFDNFVSVPPLPGLHAAGDDTAAEAALAAVREQRFDVIVQLHGSGPRSNHYVAQMAPRISAGYCLPDEAPPDGVYFPYPEGGTEIARNLALALRLGGVDAGPALEMPVTADDYSKLASLLRGAGVSLGGYVCVHPGARLPSRRWPAERFAAVADGLSQQGLQIVLTGSAGEAGLVDEVRRAMRGAAIDLAGKTSLGELAALVADAELIVSNDTGVVHVAAGLGTPSVVVASGSDPNRWAASDTSLHRTLAAEVECRPCMHTTCPIGHPCALGITPEMVLAEAEALIAGAAEVRW